MFSEVLLEDLKQIVSDNNIQWDFFRCSTVLITGATGLIGSSLVRALYAASQKYELGIRILALGRNIEKAKQLFESYGIEFIEKDICEALEIDAPVHFIFHCAAVTKSSEMVDNPVGVIETSFLGTKRVLELAKEKRVKSMVFISSMEIYGKTDSSLHCVTENDLGFVDLMKARSCYPESKRICESLCNCYCIQYGVPVKSARLAQTFGAGSPKDDTRVFAQFARNAMSGEDIVLHTEGKSLGNYCYISDSVRALLLLLLKGKNGEAYNVANPAASMKILNMANLVAMDVCAGKIKVVFDKPADIQKLGYASDTENRLNVDKLCSLGWMPTYGLKEIYERLLDDWRENIDA